MASQSHDRASYACALAKPNRLIESSRSLGWSALLLDHHEGVGRSEVFETHPTSDLTLVVALAGQHRIEVLGKGRERSAIYQPSTAGMTPPGESARLRWTSMPATRSFRTAHLYLPGPLVLDAADEYRRAGQRLRDEPLTALAFRDGTVRAQVGALLAALRADGPDLYAAGAARWLVVHLLSRHTDWHHVRSDPRTVEALSDRRLARVVDFMGAHLSLPVTLDQLAREAGISVHHFGRLFRAQTGLGPAAYLTVLRIDKARQLLRTTDLSVGEIAAACGYGRASAFATAFLRHVGCAPSAYRAASGPSRSRGSRSPSRGSGGGGRPPPWQ